MKINEPPSRFASRREDAKSAKKKREVFTIDLGLLYIVWVHRYEPILSIPYRKVLKKNLAILNSEVRIKTLQDELAAGAISRGF